MKNAKALVSIVDDEEIIRSIIKMLLLRKGYEIAFEAENGAECIKQLQVVSIFPDLIIVDVEMPIMNGFETVKKIKSNWPFIKILVHSGSIEPLTKERILAIGADAYLAKGAENEKIVDMIEKLSRG